jgi:hypothetical protein
MLAGSTEFSFVAGGPFHRIMRRTIGAGGEPMSARSGIILALLVWLPLLALAAAEGQLLRSSSVSVPFLLDFEVHARFLLALPLLIVAEQVAQERMLTLLQQFLERDLIPQNAMPRFEAAVASALRLRNSVLAEILIIAFVYGVGMFIWREYVVLNATTWYAVPIVDGFRPSYAGLFYGYISLPIFQFLLLRWFYRVFIWARFLWQVSRIRLNLIPTHPDRLAGLGFLPGMTKALAVLATAFGALLAGWMATRILVVGHRLTEFGEETALVVAFVLCLILGPLLVFVPMLAAAQRKGRREYGALASRYMGAFDSKWISSAPTDTETLLGNADTQSLADLGNTYALVQSMRIIPVTFDLIRQIVIATLAPIAPLLLTIMPLEELIKKLASILF